MRDHVRSAHRRDRLAAGRRSPTRPFDLLDRPITPRRPVVGRK